EVDRVADDGAAVADEDLHLAQVRNNEQLDVLENPWCGRNSHHRAPPADPLGPGKGHDRPGLADIEVVEAVEQRARQPAALEEPWAPPLPAVVVVLPFHQRAAAWCLRARR